MSALASPTAELRPDGPGAAPAIDPQLARRHGLGPREVAVPTVVLCAAALLAQVSAAWAASSGRLPVALAVAVASLAAYAQFTVAHDAAHRAVSRIAWLNDAVGVLATLALFAPFAAFRKVHLHHHAHTNDPSEDPDFWVVGRTWPGTLARFATTWPHYYRVYFTRLFAWDGGLLQSVVTVAALLASLVAAASSGHLREALLFWFLPAQIAVTALAFLFDYLPHRPHTERGRLRDTAAIEGPGLGAVFLEQNLHLLHHLFPTIPWYRYRRAYAEIRPALVSAGAPVRSLRGTLALLSPRLSRGLRWGRAPSA